jgi:hypothetical protein
MRRNWGVGGAAHIDSAPPAADWVKAFFSPMVTRTPLLSPGVLAVGSFVDCTDLQVMPLLLSHFAETFAASDCEKTSRCWMENTAFLTRD